MKLPGSWITRLELLAIAAGLLLIFCAAARAQTTDRMGLDHGSAQPYVAMQDHAAPGAQRVNTTPARRKVQLQPAARWARRMWRVSELTTVASWQADAGTTQTYLHNGSGCTESAPGMGPNPSAKRLYGISGAMYGVLLGLEEYVDHTASDRPDVHIAMIFVNGFATFAHSFAALNNRACL